MINRGSAAWAAATSEGIISFKRRGFAAGNGKGAVIPTRAEGTLRSVRGRAIWLVTGAVAILAAAEWLRAPSVPYLVTSAVATALTLAAAVRFGPRSRWTAGFIVTMVVFAIAAAMAQRSIARIDQSWNTY